MKTENTSGIKTQITIMLYTIVTNILTGIYMVLYIVYYLLDYLKFSLICTETGRKIDLGRKVRKPSDPPKTRSNLLKWTRCKWCLLLSGALIVQTIIPHGWKARRYQNDNDYKNDFKKT